MFALQVLDKPGTADLSTWVDFGALRQGAQVCQYLSMMHMGGLWGPAAGREGLSISVNDALDCERQPSLQRTNSYGMLHM